MKKIKRVSKFFRILFQCTFFAIILFWVFAWVSAPQPITFFERAIGLVITAYPQNIPVLHPLSINTKLLGFLIDLIPMFFHLMVLFYLIKLFKLYEHGKIFLMQDARYIRNVGYMLLMGQLVNPIYDFLSTMNLTWNNPHGHRFASITFNGTNISIIIAALLVILISWIMAEGCKLQEEHQLTI